jgi:murein DD-endopeptidase MepM/ murein hydrolase activator NlpD
MSAAYGTRRYLNGKYNGYHSGVDFASPHGYPIKSPANAIVALARYFSKYNSNGNTIFLDHGQGVTSVYIHMSKLAVKNGDRVKKGQTIGYIGTTGRSTGPHLHWGVYLNGHNTDGMSWIRFSERAFR